MDSGGSDSTDSESGAGVQIDSGDPDTGTEDTGSFIDEDADGYGAQVDCDDTDCGTNSSCIDFCCSFGDATTATEDADGNPSANGLCHDASARSCVCTGGATSYCCAGTAGGGAWDQPCIDAYLACGADCSN